MEMLFYLCAILGGTVMICQFLLSLLGLGGEADGFDGDLDGADAVDDQHVDSSWLFGVITFRTVVAALAFFGLAGLAANAAGLTPGITLLVALAAGGGAMYGVYSLMQLLRRLRADGTVRIERSLGLSGAVYVPVPAGMAGAGKVQLRLQNRTVEYQAMTADQEKLPTGARIVVVEVLGPDTVEVTAQIEHQNGSPVDD